MKGGIDEVRIYNQALDDGQILSLFNLETPMAAPLASALVQSSALPQASAEPQVNVGFNRSLGESMELQPDSGVSDASSQKLVPELVC